MENFNNERRPSSARPRSPGNAGETPVEHIRLICEHIRSGRMNEARALIDATRCELRELLTAIERPQMPPPRASVSASH